MIILKKLRVASFLPNPENVTPFLRWNKQKDRARREMHFYGIETSKML